MTNIQHPFIIRALSILGIERMYLNMINVTYDRPRANILTDPKNKGQRIGYILYSYRV